MIQQNSKIDDSEDVARMISSEWIVDGILQQTAFMLNPKETYLSVNRPCVDSYEEDVSKFVSNHERFRFENDSYKRALLSVLDVRSIKVYNDSEELLNVNIEVEARNVHTKSHAGIFVRSGSTNIIPERQLPEEVASKHVSVDMVLQDIRWGLLELAELQECKITEGKQE